MSKTYKNLTKMQVETAEQVLRDALRKRTAEITANKEEIARKKHEAAVKNIIAETKTFISKISKLKKNIEKDNNFFVLLTSNSYQDPIRDIEKELTQKSILRVKRKEGNYSSESIFTPDTTKEEEIIKNFILELKLGTAVMEDLKSVLDIIKSIK